MTTELEKRLGKIEKKLMINSTLGFWAELANNRVRINRNGRKRSDTSFDTVLEAVSYLEGEIANSSGVVIGSIVLDNICDLLPAPDVFEKIIEQIMPIESFKEKTGVFLGVLKKEGVTDPVSILFCMIASALQHFKTVGFFSRWKNGQITEEDNQLYSALRFLYCQGMEGEEDEKIKMFNSLFMAVTGLE